MNIKMNRYVQALMESMPHRPTRRHGHKPGLTTDPGGHGPVGGRVTTTGGNGNGNGNGATAAATAATELAKRRTEGGEVRPRPEAERQQTGPESRNPNPVKKPEKKKPEKKKEETLRAWTEYQRIGRILYEVAERAGRKLSPTAARYSDASAEEVEKSKTVDPQVQTDVASERARTQAKLPGVKINPSAGHLIQQKREREKGQRPRGRGHGSARQGIGATTPR